MNCQYAEYSYSYKPQGKRKAKTKKRDLEKQENPTFLRMAMICFDYLMMMNDEEFFTHEIS